MQQTQSLRERIPGTHRRTHSGEGRTYKPKINRRYDTPTPAPATLPATITKWAAAIAIGEGANPTLHNPGNLKYSTLTASWGAKKGPTASDGGNLCQFADENAGQTALCNFLVLGCEDELTAFHAPAARILQGFTEIYVGNPPQGYIDRIVETLGVPADTQISTFLS